MIQGVHHVQITIPKGMEEAGRQFYCQVLGLIEIEKPMSLQGRGGFWLQLGQQEIHVGTEEDVDRTRTKAHVAYEVSEIEKWRKRLAKEQIKIIESVPIPGYDRFEFRDPFGNRVEMIQQLMDR